MVSGRTAIAPRALETVARGVAADRLEVDVAKVSIRLGDTNGLLAVAIAAPVRTAPLGSSEGPTGTVATGLVTASEQARADIAYDIARLTGSEVGTVTLRITGVQIEKGRRVS